MKLPEWIRVPQLLRWLRASQAILFEASIVPALVGMAAALGAGAGFDPVRLALILVSLVGIQAGANLFKGYYEGRDRCGPPSAQGSWLAFDSGVASVALDPSTVLRVGRACFLVGVVAGLAVVALAQAPILLAFGVAGAVLAWSYSSPPLQLSYRGIGELSTFLAFGPIMTVGATVAFGGAGIRDSLLASIVLGFLASAISFARYFPNRDEDASKGKRTPVTIFGPDTSRRIFYGLLFAPYLVGVVWVPVARGFLWIVTLIVCVLFIYRLFPAATSMRSWERIIALTIATHALVGVALVYDLIAGS
jgi:1,4-dihydroxy-2-naphthoate octaprenyltransferase